MSKDKWESSLERAKDLAKQGQTLSYRGRSFTPTSFTSNPQKDGENITPLQAFTERFSNLGALVIRLHIGQGQRAGLLQQISKSTYASNPVEKPAKGGDDEALFFDTQSAEEAKAVGQMYEFASHQPLGRGKLLNERAQPLIHINKAKLYGEQAIWDIIHAPVWGVGRSMQFELTKQGFSYIEHPHDVSVDEMQLLSQQLEDTDVSYISVFERHDIKPVLANIQDLEICLDDRHEFTQDKNGIAIKLPGKQNSFGPLGWIVHNRTGQVLPRFITEDIMRVKALSEGGFYEKRPQQQKILQGGSLTNTTGQGLFTQNQAFNAMYVIFDYLERYDFDPRPLLDNSLSITYQRLQRKCKEEPDIIDDFLVGALQDEMVQPLRISQSRSKRSELPLRFTNHFEVTLNNLKAIAYAFGLQDSSGQPIFRAYDDNPIIPPKEGRIDCTVNGKLATPSFNTGSSVAAILATAALIAQHLLLEQLLPEIPLHGTDSSFYQLCVALLGEHQGKTLIDDLLKTIADFPVENQQVVLGAQFEYCQNLLCQLLAGLRLDKLPKFILLFANPAAHTNEVMEQLEATEKNELISILRTLHVIGDLLQRSFLTTGEPEQSRGILAGLNPLIARLSPELAAELQIQDIFVADVLPINKEKARDRVSTKMYEKCPFLAGKTTSQVTSAHSPSFFNKNWLAKEKILVGAAVIGAAVIGSIYIKSK